MSSQIDPARLIPLFHGTSKAAYLFSVAVWAVAMWQFWFWWLTPAHNIWAFGYLTVTVILFWVTVVPLYVVVIVLGARRIRGELELPVGSRVAMVVTKAPSEPADVLKVTLTAMLAQDVDHDTWLADEDPSPEMVRWCQEHGVCISTRKGIAEYHRLTWPRRTRCKEGNLAYFYDQFGYENYDFVAQLDADHVPAPGYFREILKPFADPSVGYVSAPSICDANTEDSWAAQGRLHAEAGMHGALQVGYNNGWAPLCIGSHYAVRTAALKQIGGLGPELAEDHSTTLMFNAYGWRGVHAVDAIAHGDGPPTFTAFATQEFQWARSLTTILLQYTPTYIRPLSGKKKFQFVFSQLWYPMFSVFMFLMYLLPIIALLRAEQFVGVTFPDFMLHFIPVGASFILIAYTMRRTGIYRPQDAPISSWQSAAFLFARWPWSLAGCIAAVRDFATGTFVDFRVTPKGNGPAQALPMRVLAPYAVLSVGSALPALLISDAGKASGFYIFAILNAAIYGGILCLIVWRHARENGISLGVSGASLAFTRQSALVLALLSLPVGAGALRGAEGLSAVTWGIERIQVPSADLFGAPEVERDVAPDVGVSPGGAAARSRLGDLRVDDRRQSDWRLRQQ